MLQRLALCAFAALLAAAPRAFAQEYSPVRWSVFGGANAPLSNTSDILQTGYDLGFAVTWRTILGNSLLALGYALPFSFVAYLVLKNREVAA